MHVRLLSAVDKDPMLMALILFLIFNDSPPLHPPTTSLLALSFLWLFLDFLLIALINHLFFLFLALLFNFRLLITTHEESIIRIILVLSRTASATILFVVAVLAITASGLPALGLTDPSPRSRHAVVIF